MQFQNQCKRLPKSLRDWEAYLELKKTIDDFLELQPLLELLAVPAVRDRSAPSASPSSPPRKEG